jgi:hypothetical protein
MDTDQPSAAFGRNQRTTGRYCRLIEIRKKKVSHKEHKDHQGKMVKRCVVHGVNSSFAIFVLFVLFVA